MAPWYLFTSSDNARLKPTLSNRWGSMTTNFWPALICGLGPGITRRSPVCPMIKTPNSAIRPVSSAISPGASSVRMSKP